MSTIKQLICVVPLVMLLAACAREPTAAPAPTAAAPTVAATTAGTEQSAAANAVATNPSGEPAAAPVTAATNGGKVVPGAASRAFIDPITGELRAPTSEELAALNAERVQSGTASDVKQQTPVEEIQLPGGLIEVPLGERVRQEEKVCVLVGGRIGPCPSALQEAGVERPAMAK